MGKKGFELVAGLALLLHGGTEGELDEDTHGAGLHVGDEKVENFLVGVLDRPV